MNPALEGVTLLDLLDGIAGPYAAMLLTDMGARTIKLESPRANPERAQASFSVWNRGKASVTADLETPGGRALARRLAQEADVVMSGFSRRRARALGLDYPSLRHANERLIYCSLSAYGEAGPLSLKPATDAVVAAESGIMGEQGGVGGAPVYIVLPLPSYGAAFLAAYAVCAALFAREADGQGQKIDVSLLSGALAMNTGNSVMGPGITPVGGERRKPTGVIPVYRLYRCRDQWMFLACAHNVFWNKLCLTLGLDECLVDPRYENAPWGITAPEDQDELAAIIGDKLCTQPRDYWLKLFQEADVPCAPVLTREEAFLDPQVGHNRMVVMVKDPALGEMRQMGIPVSLSATPGAVRGPAPRLGQHTREVLQGLGYGPEEIAQLKREGAI